MIIGYFLAVLLVLLLVRRISRALKWKQVDRFLSGIHKYLAVFLFALIVVHIVLTFQVWKTRAILVMVTGFLCVAGALLTTISFYLRKQFLEKWKKIHRWGAVLTLIFLCAHIAIYFVDFNSYQQDIQHTDIIGVSAKGVADGIYEGAYDVGYISVKVKVTVENQQITNILLVQHNNERGARGEAVIQEILKSQTTKVDAVSGATNSSKVIMKAVENAISK